VWAAIQAGLPRPHDAACREILVQVMRTARARGLPASTADAVAATTQAQNLARLRRRPEPGLEEVLDAVQSTFVKGALHTHGAAVEDVHREVLVGHRVGQVAEAAGRPALLQSFYQTAKRLKLDLSGASKTVRCDPAKLSRHKDKSAFLHQCDLLEIPVFEALPGRRFDSEPTHYRGANWTTGEDARLVAETWAIRWCEAVDDRLLELSDRGPTLAAVAQDLVTESLLGVQDDVAAAVRLLLRTVQMRLDTGVDEALRDMETAVVRDHSFAHLCQALADLVVLHG